MLVKDIIKKVVNYTNNFELYQAIVANNFTTAQQNEINLLVDCVNLTNANIATNYVRLFASTEVSNSSGTIAYSKITTKTIYEIISVKNQQGIKLNFSLSSDGITTDLGSVIVTYTYFPDNILYTGQITNYSIKINERIFVYGVIAEYLYVKGVFDEAQIWEERFKNEMKSLLRLQKNIALKKRGWY